MKRTIIFICVLLTTFFVNAQETEPQTFSPQPLIDKVTRTGKLEFKRTINLSFKSSGYLQSLYIEEGQTFNKGEQLASLDISELEQQKVAAYVQLANAKSDAARAAKLLKNGLGSEDARDDAQALVDNNRANYKVALYNLEKSTIIAPFKGIVLSRHTELNELQTPGAPVLTVASLQSNWVVRVTLTEQEVIQLTLNQEVDVRLRKVGQVAGMVTKIPALADPATNLYTIEVSLPDIAIKKGMIAGQLAEVTLHFTDDSLVYRVPLSALAGVDEEGKALLISKVDDQLTQLALPILKLDNHYAYIAVSQANTNIKLFTQGLQHIQLSKQ